MNSVMRGLKFDAADVKEGEIVMRTSEWTPTQLGVVLRGAAGASVQGKAFEVGGGGAGWQRGDGLKEIRQGHWTDG